MRFFAINGADDLGQEIARMSDVDVDPCEFRDFEDSEHKGRPLVSVRNEDIFILAYLHGDTALSVNDRLVRLLLFTGACRDNGAARTVLLLPFLPYARKDRRTKSRDPVSSRYVAQLLETVGAGCVVTFGAHNLSALQNAFRIPTIHFDLSDLMTQPILERRGSNPLAVVSPDTGGVKRAQLLLESLARESGEDIGFGVMEKRRSKGVVSGELFAGNVAGHEVWIVDDMIVSGGTMLRAAQACRTAGAVSVRFAAAHALFNVEAARRMNDAEIATLLVTNSVPIHDQVFEALGERLQVVSIAPQVASAIASLGR